MFHRKLCCMTTKIVYIINHVEVHNRMWLKCLPGTVSLTITRHMRLERYWSDVRFFVSLIQNSAFPQNPLAGLIKWENPPNQQTQSNPTQPNQQNKKSKQTKVKWSSFILFHFSNDNYILFFGTTHIIVRNPYLNLDSLLYLLLFKINNR